MSVSSTPTTPVLFFSLVHSRYSFLNQNENWLLVSFSLHFSIEDAVKQLKTHLQNTDKMYSARRDLLRVCYIK